MLSFWQHPNQFHEEQLISAANKGKQVFCEKPVALKYESIKRMASACKKNGIILGVGHERRWEPAMVKLRDMLDELYLEKSCTWRQILVTISL